MLKWWAVQPCGTNNEGIPGPVTLKYYAAVFMQKLLAKAML